MSSKAQLILALALGVAESCEFASFIISGGGCGGTAASLGIFETASLCAEAAYATPACAEGLATMPAYIEFDSVTGGCGCCDTGGGFTPNPDVELWEAENCDTGVPTTEPTSSPTVPVPDCTALVFEVRPDAVARLRLAAGAVATELQSLTPGPLEAAGELQDPARWLLPSPTEDRAEVVAEQSCSQR